MDKEYNISSLYADDKSGWLRRIREELNDSQLELVTASDQAILGLAGPGSGKTRALTYRVAHLINIGVSAKNILLVTFTNKAAGEMKERVRRILGVVPQDLWAGTFHSIGARILRRHSSLVGRRSNFTILDEDDRSQLVRSCVTSLNYEFYGEEKSMFIRRNLVADLLSKAKNFGCEIGDLVESRYPDYHVYINLFRDAANLYEQRKKQLNAFDFDDLIVEWLKLFQYNEPVRQRYQKQFRHVLVDEFQDTNEIQACIVNILGKEGKICVVGDDAQSIYGFRCAQVGNIITFPKKYAACRVVRLELNYRSTPQIVALANNSIHYNNQQLSKTLVSPRRDGEKPWVVYARDSYQEAGFIAQHIQELYNKGLFLGNIAVLYRSTYLSQEIELELMQRGIPYVIFGGLKFLQRAHIKDVIAWLRILVNPWDELSWRRVITMQEGIGEVTFRNLWGEMVASGDPLETILSGQTSPRRGKNSWKHFVQFLKMLVESKNEGISYLINIIMENGYQEVLKKNYVDDYREREKGIQRLAAHGHRYQTLDEFLESLSIEESLIIDYVAKKDVPKDFVTLSTIHSAKGKEWKAVFILAINEGCFPSAQGENNLEEERRLFYVAVTRAEDHLFMCTYENDYRAWQNFITGPSIFLRELASDTYETVYLTEGKDRG